VVWHGNTMWREGYIFGFCWNLSSFCTITFTSDFLASMGVHCRWRWTLHSVLSLVTSSPLDILLGWYTVVFSPLWVSMTVATLLCPVPYHTPPLLLMSSWDDMQWLSHLYGCSPLMTVATLLCPVFDRTLCFWCPLGMICSGFLASMGIHHQWWWLLYFVLSFITPPLLLMFSQDDMQWFSCIYGHSLLMMVATSLCPVSSHPLLLILSWDNIQ
jgi:hypothetical protein